jgi:ribitol-5-phosphate 2-dehydrogenase
MLTNIFKITAPQVIEEFIEDVDLENKVLVKVEYMAICKADIRYYLGAREQNVLNHKYPLSPIHEAVGIVVKDPTHTFKKGDKVILIPNSIDEKDLETFANKRCEREELGPNYCTKAIFRSSNADGFLRPYYTTTPDLLVKYEDTKPELAVFSELLSVGHAALRRINFSEVDRLAIFGDGIMAYIVYILISNMYPKLDLTIFGVDDDKLAMFKNAKIAKFETYNGEKFDTLIECVGGKFSENAIDNMIDLAAVGADLILMGVSEDRVQINTRVVLEKGLSIKGVTRSSRKDFEFVAKFINNKKVQSEIAPMVISKNLISSVTDIYQCFENDIKNKKIIGKNLLFW